jgi:hypothetical protein
MPRGPIATCQCGTCPKCRQRDCQRRRRAFLREMLEGPPHDHWPEPKTPGSSLAAWDELDLYGYRLPRSGRVGPFPALS